MDKTGIVMDILDSTVVVMTKDGQFRKLPYTPGMEIGVEVVWRESDYAGPPASSKRRKGILYKPAWQRYGVAGIAASLLLAAGVWLSSSILMPQKAEAYAYVSVDINPSVILVVDKQMHVLSTQPGNADGATLLKNVHLDGDTIPQAMTGIVNEAAAEHMLPAQDAILVATAPVQPQTQVNMQNVQNQVEHDLQSALAQNATARTSGAKVFAVALSQTVFHAANSAKISPGKLAVYLVAQNEGQQVNLSHLNSNSLSQVMSSPSAKNALKILASEDLTQVEQFIHHLQTSGVLGVGGTSGKPPTGQSQTSPGNSETGASNSENGHPSPKSRGNGQSGHDTVTVHFGNTVISIPVGGSVGNLLTGSGPGPLEPGPGKKPKQSHDGQQPNESSNTGESPGALLGHSSGSLLRNLPGKSFDNSADSSIGNTAAKSIGNVLNNSLGDLNLPSTHSVTGNSILDSGLGNTPGGSNLSQAFGGFAKSANRVVGKVENEAGSLNHASNEIEKLANATTSLESGLVGTESH